MATKRRRVLLRRDDGGMAHFPAWTVVSWPAEPKDRNETTPVITFLERFPGDVVLSREDVKGLIAMAWTLAGDHRREMLALLRGRR